MKIKAKMRIAISALFFMISASSLAQVNRFQQLGVKLDPHSEEQILFWKNIYSKYTSHDYVIHDPIELSKVYAVVKSDAEVKAEKKLLQETVESTRIRVQVGQKDRLQNANIASHEYLTRMEELLAEEGVPKELARLPFVESSFNHEAKSKVGAVGIWQFMPKTAVRDLRVTDAIDERYDPLKSTRAAARYLKRSHDQFHSWALAIMAYHQGAGLVMKAIKQVHSSDPVIIMRNFKDPSFKFASRNYLFECLAMIDLGSQVNGKLPDFITISFPRKIKMNEILTHFQLKESLTRVMNPHFRPAVWSNRAPIPAHYPIRMAGITLEEFRKLQYPKDK